MRSLGWIGPPSPRNVRIAAMKPRSARCWLSHMDPVWCCAARDVNRWSCASSELEKQPISMHVALCICDLSLIRLCPRTTPREDEPEQIIPPPLAEAFVGKVKDAFVHPMHILRTSFVHAP